MELAVTEVELLAKLRAANIRIPPRSRVLENIERVLADDNASERIIGQVIARDASLTAEVFKLVNSVLYQRTTKVDSLEQAVRLLGRTPMGEIARTAILRQQLGGGDPRMERFWDRCADTGAICSMVCYALDRPGGLTTEQAYLVGLFHDCGVPVLAQHVKGYGDVALAPGAAADFLAEDDAQSTSHCIAGLMVAQEWELPEFLAEAIRSHHKVIAPEQSAPHAIAVLQLARHAYATNQGWEDSEWEQQSAHAVATLAIPPERVQGVIDEALASFEMLP